MGYYLNPSVWFNLRPGSLEPFSVYLISAILAALLVAAIVIGFYKKRYKKRMYYKIINKLFNFCLGNFFIGLIWLFFALESLPLLSARFFFLLWILGMMVWAGFILKYAKKIPEIKKSIKQENEYRKYLP